ncbi:MAG: hypothetical protein ACRD5G_01255 [Candidatus Acidiferrales bacterium]
MMSEATVNAVEGLQCPACKREIRVEAVCGNSEICRAAIALHDFLSKAVRNAAGYWRCPKCGGTSWKVREARQ